MEETKRQKIKKVHDEKAKERADEQGLLKAQYYALKDDPVIINLLEKIKSFADWHSKIAKDGVGYREDAEGKQQVVKLSPEDRVSELDKAAGIEEISDFLNRQFADPPSK